MQRQRFEVELRYPEGEHVLSMPAAGDLRRWLLERLAAEAYYARPERVEVREHAAGVDHPSEEDLHP